MEIQAAHLPPDFLEALGEKPSRVPLAPSIPLLHRTEAQIIIETLHKYKGHRGKTAHELGIDKSTLWRKMKKYGIQA
jgi:transcriptional regulator of acetoin/glycerol metabolism